MITSRDLLTTYGFNQAEASVVIPTLMRAPLQGDQDEAATYLLVLALQRRLNFLGQPVLTDGVITEDLHRVMTATMGAAWLHRNWFEILAFFKHITDRDGRFVPAPRVPSPIQASATQVSGMGEYPSVYWKLNTTRTMASPQNAIANTASTNLQLQLKRISIARPEFPMPKVDGVLGPETLAAYKAIKAKNMALPYVADINGMMNQVEAITLALEPLYNPGYVPPRQTVNVGAVVNPAAVPGLKLDPSDNAYKDAAGRTAYVFDTETGQWLDVRGEQIETTSKYDPKTMQRASVSLMLLALAGVGWYAYKKHQKRTTVGA